MRFFKRLATLISPEGLEPPAFGLKARHSNQLSYDDACEFKETRDSSGNIRGRTEDLAVTSFYLTATRSTY